MAAPVFPIIENAFFALILQILALGHCGRSVIIEVANASFEGVLLGDGVVDDFSGEIGRVAEIERRLVVEVFHGIASTDGNGIYDGVGFDGIVHGIWAGVGERRFRVNTGEEQDEDNRCQCEDAMSFHSFSQMIGGLHYFKRFFDKGFDGGVRHLFQQTVESLVDGRFAEAQYRQC